VSKDTLRRALKAIDETLGSQLVFSPYNIIVIGRVVLGLLDAPWIICMWMIQHLSPYTAKQGSGVGIQSTGVMSWSGGRRRAEGFHGFKCNSNVQVTEPPSSRIGCRM
jgi:hypothetical protein